MSVKNKYKSCLNNEFSMKSKMVRYFWKISYLVIVNILVGQELSYITSYPLNLPEPSGLALSSNGGFLYTVSDPSDNKIYRLNLGGEIQQTLNYVGDDLEGVEYVDNTLWIVEEGLRELVNVSLSGVELNRISVNYDGESNSGFEGICFRHNQESFYILNEKNPVIILDVDFNGNILDQIDFPYVDDISGICRGKNYDEYFIVSDESNELILWHANNGILNSFDIPFPKIEGVAYNSSNDKVFLVSDESEILILYQFDNYFYLGDLNNDAIINVLDVIIIVDLILLNSFEYIADMNVDNIINVLDIVEMISLIID